MVQFIKHLFSRLHRMFLSGRIFTRHGALMAARAMQVSRATPPASKVALVLTGSTLIGLGISLFVHARLGLPPYDVLISSIATRSGLSHGQSGWAVSGSLLALAAALGRRPSRYGVMFVFANGAAVDGWSRLLVDPATLGPRILFVALGTIMVAAGVAVVAHSSSTGGPFELLTGAAADRKLNPTAFRSGLELLTVVVGVALGGSLGLGTVVFVVSIGPLISITVQALGDRQTGRKQRLELADH